MFLTTPRMGDLGEDQHEVEFEPIELPGIAAPVEPVRVPEPVGAPA